MKNTLLALAFSLFATSLSAQCNFSISLPADTTVCQDTLCIVATATGTLTGPLSFVWSDGITDNYRCFTHESQKTLSVTLTDTITGCTSNDTITFSVFNAVLNDTFYTCNNGTATLDFGPGPGNTQYFWQTYTDTNGVSYNISDIVTFPINVNTQAINVSLPGQYLGFANFGSGCVLTSVFNVLPCQQNCQAVFTHIHDYNPCGDSVVFIANSWGPNTYYTWFFGDGTTFTDTVPQVIHYYNQSGTYTVFMEQTNLTCSSSFTGPVVVQGNLLTFDLGQDTTICNGYFYQNITPSGGTPPFNYIWNLPGGFQGASPTVSQVENQLVTLTITSANGCVVEDSVRVTVLNDTAVSYSGCFIPLTVCGLSTSATYYTWSTGETTPCITPPTTGTYSLVYGLATPGCTSLTQTFTVNACVQNDTVWPGDANFDGIVTNADILNLGIAYNDSGSVRVDQSIGWYGHQAQWWTSFFNYGVNYNHADCNGDGVINAADTLAVTQNYLLTHNKTENATDPMYPSLYVQAQTDTLGLGEMAIFKIMLGRIDYPLDSVYGVSFTLTYNTQTAQETTAGLNYGNSWLAPAGNKLSFQKASSGSIDVALTRTDHTNQTGFGELGSFMIVTTDNLSGITDLKVSISDARAVTSNGTDIQLFSQADSTVVLPVGIAELERLTAATQVYPNPATDKVNIACSEPIEQLEVLDLMGRTILTQTEATQQLSVSQLAKGSYQLKLLTQKGIIYKQVVVR